MMKLLNTKTTMISKTQSAKCKSSRVKVPGLAERRPSLVHGDYTFAKLTSEHDNNDAPAYQIQGFIHRVEADEVYLRFDQEFHFYHRDGNPYDVYFTYNRINMRRFYQAVEAAESLGAKFLFPSTKRKCIKTADVVPIAGTLNEEQMRSVKMILGCKGAPPYVIHGPPGTGKTSTIVEAILQLYAHYKNTRILVCAPSNSAADYILEKLLAEKNIEFRENEIFRLNAAARPYEDVKPELLRFCFFDEMVFKSPPVDALKRYRIIVSTYMSASLLYAEDVTRGHFSHIFLDEAGQASEPETMIPVSHLCRRETVVVLAGDPLQLGPVIYSKKADDFGLGISYMERLFESELYASGDANYITKLIRNYRCHPEILHLPSKLFYAGELMACRDPTTFIKTAEFLPNKEFPLLFFGIQGCDEREGNNPSWFNRIEVSKVVEIVRRLIGGGKIREEDIGIIAPYKQQALKIRQTLENLDMPEIKVGSVEQFQGQEKEVIIILTVRSTMKHNDFDKVHCLGFLSNHRRFNVAITRAISLLVIIGNPHIICQDDHWSQMLWYCVENSAYQGCSLPEKVEPSEHTGEKTNLSFNEENGQPSNNGEWGQDFQNGQHSNNGEWGLDFQNGQHSNNGEWGQDFQNGQHSNNGEWEQDFHNGQHSNNGEWGQGLRVRRGQELLCFEEIVEIIKEEYPLEKLLSLPQSQRGLSDITCSASDRVMAFQVQKFVENEQKPKVELRDLDNDIEHPYWKSYVPLKRPRLECKLFVAGGFVYSIGGVDVDIYGLDLSLEVFMGDIWRDLHILGELEWQYSGSALVLAALGKTILIGSFTSHCSPGSFYALLLIQPEVAIPLRLDIECPIEFLTGCCGLPGIVVDNRAPWDDTIVVWHDTKSNCIRGLHLGHKQHFTINFVEEKILIPDSDDRDYVNNLYYANLIGFGDGTLGMIYTGRKRHSFVDDQGVPLYMCDYRCVTFEIIYDYPDHYDRVNYPGVLVKTKIISNRKCYAPLYMQLQTTFLMDVCFPDQVENLSLSAIKERGIGLHTILQ